MEGRWRKLIHNLCASPGIDSALRSVMMWAGRVARTRRMGNVKSEGERPLGGPGRGWKYNI
jgi:hypothetical protein